MFSRSGSGDSTQRVLADVGSTLWDRGHPRRLKVNDTASFYKSTKQAISSPFIHSLLHHVIVSRRKNIYFNFSQAIAGSM